MMLNHARKSLPLLQVVAHLVPKVSGMALPTSWTFSTVYHLSKESSTKMIYTSVAAPDLPEEALSVREGHGWWPGNAGSSLGTLLFRSFWRLHHQEKYADGRRSCGTLTCSSDEVEAMEKGGGGSNELIRERLRQLGLRQSTIEYLVRRHEGDLSFPSIGEKVDLLLEGGFTIDQLTKLVSQGSLQLLRAPYERFEILLETLKKIKVSPSVLLAHHVRAYISGNKNIGSGLEVLRGLGLDEDSVAAMATKNPRLLFYSSADLRKKVAAMQEIGSDATSISIAIQRVPRILSLRLENMIASKAAFWRSMGASTPDISRILRKSPTTFSLRTSDYLSQKVDFLKQLGYKPKVIVRAASGGVFTRDLKYLLARYEFLQGQGFSREEAAFLLKTQPEIFSVGQECLAKKIDCLVNLFGYDIKEIAKCPRCLCLSLEKRIIPRCNAIAERKMNGTLRRDYRLSTILSTTEKMFQRMVMQDMPREGYTDN